MAGMAMDDVKMLRRGNRERWRYEGGRTGLDTGIVAPQSLDGPSAFFRSEEAGDCGIVIESPAEPPSIQRFESVEGVMTYKITMEQAAVSLGSAWRHAELTRRCHDGSESNSEE